MANPGDPTSATGKRVGAYCIDAIALCVLMFVGFVTGYSVESQRGNVCESAVQRQGGQEMAVDVGFDRVCIYLNDPAQNTNESVIIEGNPVVLIALPMVYIVFAIALMGGVAGGSPGKLLVGLRVVKTDGTPASVGQSCVRTAFWFVDALPGLLCCPFAPLVGFITMMTTSKHQRVGDLVAKTYVVPVAFVGQPLGAAVAYATPWGTPAGDPNAPPRGATDGQGTPQWDEARRAWIQYSPTRGQWLQHNPSTDTWGPIS